MLQFSTSSHACGTPPSAPPHSTPQIASKVTCASAHSLWKSIIIIILLWNCKYLNSSPKSIRKANTFQTETFPPPSVGLEGRAELRGVSMERWAQPKGIPFQMIWIEIPHGLNKTNGWLSRLAMCVFLPVLNLENGKDRTTLILWLRSDNPRSAFPPHSLRLLPLESG